MTTTRKSFAISLAFHTLMGALAFLILFQMRTPPPMLKVSLTHMSVVTLSNQMPIPKPQSITTPSPVKTQLQVPIKPLIQITPTPSKTAVTPLPSIVPTPAPMTSPAIVSAPVQQPIQHVAAPVSVPAKPKIDLSSEKKSFFSSLRANIQNQLRYPPVARRRGMEGEVGVRFLLSSDGMINHISVQRGENIFHNAAIAAVNAASGIDVPKSLTESMPMEIELTLEFKLNS